VTTAASAWGLGGDLLLTRLEAIGGEVSATATHANAGVQRLEIWRATLDLIKASPLAGSGLGAYQTAITPFHRGSGAWTPEAAHNDYLELAASGGAIGLILALWFIKRLVTELRANMALGSMLSWGPIAGAMTALVGVA